MRYLALLFIGAPGLLLAWAYALKRPFTTLAFYAAVVPFASLVSLPLGLPSPFNTLSTTIGMVTLAIIGLHVAMRPKERWQLDTTSEIWLAFLFLAASSVLWSINPAGSQNQLLVLGGLIGLYVAVSLLPVQWARVELIEKAIIGGGAITGAYGVLLLVTGDLHQTRAGSFRFETAGGGGDGADPNITAAALLLPLALALAYYVRPGLSHRRLRYLTATALIVGGIVLTGSRGGLLSLLVVIGVTYLNDRRHFPRLGVVVVAVAAIIMLVPGTVTDRILGVSSTGRTEIWSAGLDACPEYCVFGAGWGTFSDVFEEAWLADPSIAVSNPRIGAHNVWLGVAIEVGVAGFALLVVGLGIAALRLASVPPVRRGPALAGLAGVLFANTFIANLDFKYFWLVLTYALLVYMANEDERRRALASRLRKAVKPSPGPATAPSNGSPEPAYVPDLSDVNGVAHFTALQLRRHGITTVEQLARVPLAELTAIPGFREKRALKTRRAAALLLIALDRADSASAHGGTGSSRPNGSQAAGKATGPSG